MRKDLQIADLGDLLEQPLNAILATSLSGGEILLAPVWHEWRDGGFSVVIVAGDVKDRHLQRNPRASLIVAENGGLGRGVEVQGSAICSRDDADEVNRRIVHRYLEAERATVFLRELEGTRLVHVRLEPGKIRAWDFADEEVYKRLQDFAPLSRGRVGSAIHSNRPPS